MRFSRWSTWLPAVLFLLVFCGAAHAQNRLPARGPLTFEVASPLALTEKPLALQVRHGRWFPVAVTLSNSGDPVQGVLSLRLKTATAQSRKPAQYFTDVDLPTNARKRIWLYGRVESEDVNAFEITFQGRGFKTMKADGIVQIAAPQTRLILTISDSDEKLSYLAGLKGVGLGLPQKDTSTPNFPQGVPGANNPNLNQNAAPLRPLGASHELIPSRWIGLDALDLVVLQDFSHIALTPNQIAALRGYVASGGALLALGGANWQRLSTSPLADLWPVNPQSSGTASAAAVSTLVDRFARFPVMTGADRLGGAPVVATRGVLRPGSRVLLGEKNAPLLASGNFGAGQVLFLAVDLTQPPFIGWRGHERMWAAIFRPTARPEQIASVGDTMFDEEDYPYGYHDAHTTSATDGILESLKTSKQLKTPPVSAIAWFLALYVFFLVPVNYVVLRYFDRRELAWITIPVIVLAFSVMSYAAALRIKGTAILTRQVNIVQTSAGSGLGRADAMLWLFSPRKTTYDISSRDPQMALGDYFSDKNVAVAIRQPEENQAFSLENAPINMWDWRSFVGHSTTDLKGGVRAIVQNGKVGIANHSPHDLKGVVLVCGGRVLGFRTVRAGSTSFAAKSDGKKDNASRATAQLIARIRRVSRLDLELPGNQVGGFESIPDRLLSTVLTSDWSTPATFIVAWSDKPFAGLTIGREDARAQNLTLLIARVEDDAALRAALERNRSASTPARVRRLSVEALSHESGSIFNYESQLPDTASAKVMIGLTTTDSVNEWEAGLIPVMLELFDAQNGSWHTVTMSDLEAEKLKMQSNKAASKNIPSSAKKPKLQKKWNLRAALSGNLARSVIQQPERRLLFRVETLNNDMQIQEVKVWQ